MQTVLCEIEAILNDRPITKLSDDANDLEPLTPNEYLPLLQQRHKLNKERRNFVRVDIVDSTAPRGSWSMGRVLEVFPDKN